MVLHAVLTLAAEKSQVSTELGLRRRELGQRKPILENQETRSDALEMKLPASEIRYQSLEFKLRASEI